MSKKPGRLRKAARAVGSLIEFGVLYLIVFGIGGALYLLIYPNLDTIVAGLYNVLVAGAPPKAAGFLASIVSAAVVFCYAAVTGNRRQKFRITRYRWVEELLVEKKHLTRDEILKYHAEYNWDVYAGISFSTLLVIVSLLFTIGESSKYTHIDFVIIFVSLLLLAVSAIILALVDMFHTNTLSPLVTSRKRFELVDVVIKLGSLAIVLQVCAITMFLSLVNPWLSIAVSVVSPAVIVFFSRLRSIPLDALTEEHNLTEEETDEVRRA
jgi:hypothetical protein